MPENVKWELLSFALKILPLLIGVLVAWISYKKPSVKKALTELKEIIVEAARIVNQVYVEPRKDNSTWGEAEKAKARELFWEEFLKLANAKAEKWITYLMALFGEVETKALITDSLEATLNQGLKN